LSKLDHFWSSIYICRYSSIESWYWVRAG
jgi:hypothetical protein